MPPSITLPLRIQEHTESFEIKDAAKRTVAYFYYSRIPDHASATQRLLRDDARVVAKICARALTDAVEKGDAG